MGLKDRRLTEEEMEKICGMYNSGMTYREIAEESGWTSNSSISFAINYGIECGLVTCRKQKNNPRKNKSRALHGEPVNWNEFNPGMGNFKWDL